MDRDEAIAQLRKGMESAKSHDDIAQAYFDLSDEAQEAIGQIVLQANGHKLTVGKKITQLDIEPAEG